MTGIDPMALALARNLIADIELCLNQMKALLPHDKELEDLRTRRPSPRTLAGRREGRQGQFPTDVQVDPNYQRAPLGLKRDTEGNAYEDTTEGSASDSGSAHLDTNTLWNDSDRFPSASQ